MADASYAHRPLSAKLGIKAGSRVTVLGGPPGIDAMLMPLPAGVSLTAKMDERSDLFLCFVASRSQLAHRLGTLPQQIERRPLWLMWPKKSSGVKADIDGNAVREAGLACGLVDYKICSVDSTWSGMAFKKRR